MKKLNLLPALLIIFILYGCASTFKDIKVETEKDQKVDLSGYKTYAWAASAQLVKDSEGQWVAPNMDLNSEIKYLVDRELRKKGYTEVENNPDMIISAAIGVDVDALQIKKDPGTNMDILENVPKSALIIALTDVSTGFPIWIGAATGNAQKKPQVDMVKKRLDYAISQIFKNFPK